MEAAIRVRALSKTFGSRKALHDIELEIAPGEMVGWHLPKAVNTVTRNPALAIGLADRGEIAPGRRADFIRVKESDGIPIVRGSWCKGERAF